MTSRKKPIPAWVYGSLAIIVFLGGLALFPSLLRQTNLEFRRDAENAAAGKPFPLQMEFPDLRNKRKLVSLKMLAGENEGGLLINFWATWCPPCIEELPTLEILGRQLAEKNDPRLPRLITVSVDEKPEDVDNLFRSLNYKVTFPVLYDKSGAFSTSVGTVKFPETYWVSNSGQIIKKWVGPQDWMSGDILRLFKRVP